MVLLGQLGAGESVESWAIEADFEASTLEELTAADSAAVQKATGKYAELVLRDSERVYWRWQRGMPVATNALLGKKDEPTATGPITKGEGP